MLKDGKRIFVTSDSLKNKMTRTPSKAQKLQHTHTGRRKYTHITDGIKKNSTINRSEYVCCEHLTHTT